jgi:carboxyl-terminal processing protease
MIGVSPSPDRCRGFLPRITLYPLIHEAVRRDGEKGTNSVREQQEIENGSDHKEKRERTEQSSRLSLLLMGGFMILCLNLILLCALLTNRIAKDLPAKKTHQNIVFPWDPIEWDTLRDSPLTYKSLGDADNAYFSYKMFIEDPSKIGFKSDGAIFQSVLSHIRNDYVKKVSDDDLRNSCEKELTKLFKESKIAITPKLEGYDINNDFVSKLVKDYGASVKSDLLVFASLRGLIRGLKDPHSTILSSKDYNSLMERLREEAFGGIGIYIEQDGNNDNWLTVLEPVEGTPAAKAGLHAGDIIEKINGEPTKKLSIDMAVAKLRGPIGSTVNLSIRRKSHATLMAFSIKRAAISIPSVSCRILENDIGYIRIRAFSSETGREFKEAIDAMKKGLSWTATSGGTEEDKKNRQHEPITALIIDVRNNGGGYLNAAQDLSSNFISPSKIVYKRMERDGSIRDYHGDVADRVDLPMVLLVNRFSASSSEIFAGAIKDNKAGTLIGERTFGKGSVQQMFRLKEESSVERRDNSVLKLTVSYFLTPTGRIINKKGMKPDIFVDMKPNQVGKSGDVQLREAISFLRHKRVSDR